MPAHAPDDDDERSWHAAGWSKYRIAQRLGITRRAVDEALTAD